MTQPARSTAKPDTRAARERPDGGAPAGAQTLARGLTALTLISESPHGLGIQEVARELGVHRTVASRLLATLASFRLVARHDDGRFRPAAALAVLGASFDNSVREVAMPVLRRLAHRTGTTASLLVAEDDEQVAILVIVPHGVPYRLTFQEGSRRPLERGAAGLALLACAPARPGEREEITFARDRGWVMTHGEVEPNTFGLAVPVPRTAPAPQTCINLISHRSDVLEAGLGHVTAAAAELGELLS
ncbi:IclR family transcriptional regulator [Spirillospora sp. CA-108201]